MLLQEDGTEIASEDLPEPLMPRQAHQVRDIRRPPDEIFRVRPEHLGSEHPVRRGAVLQGGPHVRREVRPVRGRHAEA
jgi:hypothetical protein